MAIRHLTSYEQHTAIGGIDSKVEPAAFFNAAPGKPLYEMPPRDFHQVFPDSRRVVVMGAPLLGETVTVVDPTNANGEQQ